MRKYVLLALVMAASLAQSQGVYNYFPPPGVTYSPGGGMALGGATGGGEGSGTLNATQLYVNGVAVSTGTVTSVGLTTPSWLTVTGSPVTIAGTLAVTAAAAQTKDEFVATPCNANGAVALRVLCTQDFPASGVTAGTYTAASVTVDVTGRVTAANSNSFVTSVGFAEASTTPIFSITNSPVTSSGTLTETLKTQSANTVFAGPSIGSATQPAFRPLVPADLPLSSNITWTGQHTFTPASGVGITVNGRSTSDSITLNNGASQFARVVGNNGTGTSNGLDIVAGTNGSDVPFQITNRAATTLWQMTGTGASAVTPTSGVALTVTGASAADAMDINPAAGRAAKITGSSTSGQSDGLLIFAGTTSGDTPLQIVNQNNTLTLFSVFGDGGVEVGAPSGGNKGTGTINTSGVYESGVRLPKTSYALLNISGSACTISGSFQANNVASCSYGGAGDYLVNFTVAYSSIGPSCTGTSVGSSSPKVVTIATTTISQVEVISSLSTTGTKTDGNLFVTCYGN